LSCVRPPKERLAGLGGTQSILQNYVATVSAQLRNSKPGRKRRLHGHWKEASVAGLKLNQCDSLRVGGVSRGRERERGHLATAVDLLCLELVGSAPSRAKRWTSLI